MEQTGKSFAAREAQKVAQENEHSLKRGERKKELGNKLKQLLSTYFKDERYENRPAVMTVSGVASALRGRARKSNVSKEAG